MRSTLLSDAHVRSLDDPSQRDLVRFLREWPTDEVVFVGDLVDVWWGWRRAVFIHTLPLMGALLDLRDRGVRVTWVRGNHDFEPGSAVREELGVHVVSRWSRSTEYARVLASHGDVPTTRRQALLDRALHSKVTRVAARLAGPDLTWTLIDRASAASRSRHTADKSQLLAAQAAWADVELADGADVVCLGHSHAPGVERRPGGGTLVNLGDWVQHRSFAVVDDTNVTLSRWVDGKTTEISGPPSARSR
ncbi:MAG: UDP-2,3-diacylglucosamine hydrolase [Kiritimatiellia bacterium]|jgi:UDP-2,3-diacylglucosamine hydrolase